MPKNLVQQIHKAVALAADHAIEIGALCLSRADVELLRAANIGDDAFGLKISGGFTDDSSLCGTFRNTPVAIVLSDFPVVERL